MSVAQALKAKALELRKTRDELAGALQAVLSIANDQAKQRHLKSNLVTPNVVSEDDALLAINRSLKQVADTLQNIEAGNGRDTPLYARTLREREILQELLPPAASEEDVTIAAKAYVVSAMQGGTPLNMKLMGPTMQHLSEMFGSALNKQTASGIVKGIITP